MAPDPKPQFNPTEPESIPLDFGYAVAVGELRSEWLVVGAPGSRRLWSPVDPPRNDVGRVFVYHRDPSSSVRSGPGTKEWQYMASFEPGSDSNALATGNRFGACVAIAGGDGNRMAVGAPGFDEGKGAVTLFSRVGKSWAAYRRITASEPSKGALFGYSIAIGVHDTRPSVVVIGAPGSALDIRDSSGAVTATLPNCGKVFLYEISGVRADEANDSPFSRNFGDGEANMRYGTSIAVGNSEARLVVVGAPGVGRVFMLRQSAAGNWANEGGNLGIKAKDEEECTAAHCVKSFGTSVAILSKVDVRQSGTGGGDKNLDGNYILVGAPLATIGAGSGIRAGKLYPLYYGAWDPIDRTRWKNDVAIYHTATDGMRLGSAMACSGDGPQDGLLRCAIGAPSAAEGNPGTGYGYGLDVSFTSWDTLAPTHAPSDAPTSAPTAAPSLNPTNVPTEAPTLKPTAEPTAAPSAVPTTGPTITPLSPDEIWTVSAFAVLVCFICALCVCGGACVALCAIIGPIGCRREQEWQIKKHMFDVDAAVTNAKKQSEFEMSWFKKPTQYATAKGMRVRTDNGMDGERGAASPRSRFSPLGLLSPGGNFGARAQAGARALGGRVANAARRMSARMQPVNTVAGGAGRWPAQQQQQQHQQRGGGDPRGQVQYAGSQQQGQAQMSVNPMAHAKQRHGAARVGRKGLNAGPAMPVLKPFGAMKPLSPIDITRTKPGVSKLQKAIRRRSQRLSAQRGAQRGAAAAAPPAAVDPWAAAEAKSTQVRVANMRSAPKVALMKPFSPRALGGLKKLQAAARRRSRQMNAGAMGSVQAQIRAADAKKKAPPSTGVLLKPFSPRALGGLKKLQQGWRRSRQMKAGAMESVQAQIRAADATKKGDAGAAPPGSFEPRKARPTFSGWDDAFDSALNEIEEAKKATNSPHTGPSPRDKGPMMRGRRRPMMLNTVADEEEDPASPALLGLPGPRLTEQVTPMRLLPVLSPRAMQGFQSWKARAQVRISPVGSRSAASGGTVGGVIGGSGKPVSPLSPRAMQGFTSWKVRAQSTLAGVANAAQPAMAPIAPLKPFSPRSLGALKPMALPSESVAGAPAAAGETASPSKRSKGRRNSFVDFTAAMEGF
jgi:hypothetical protein